MINGMRVAGLVLMLAVAGCNTVTEPDPSAKTMSRDELRVTTKEFCIRRVTKENNLSAEAAEKGCGCYASRTVGSLNKAEFAAFRDQGYFNDSAREKALTSLDICRVPRP